MTYPGNVPDWMVTRSLCGRLLCNRLSGRACHRTSGIADDARSGAGHQIQPGWSSNPRYRGQQLVVGVVFEQCDGAVLAPLSCM